MTFRLYDTARGQVVDFTPLVEGQVSIYHCGLTVQSAPHVGHIRKEVVFDVLRRWLTYCGYRVRVVANVTDIDDKILAKSAAAGEDWFAHAYRFERELHHAYTALGCLPPHYEPRATGHIPEMIAMIQDLIDRGHAYVAEDGSGDVYFDVRSWPTYGELSHQRVDDMRAAEDADPRGKRDPRDFALWKGHKNTEPDTAAWQAPWGPGRPGWHIECSAMAVKYLGSHFDIHGGGLDLRFPHHENELAQARAAGHPFAHHWMHNAWVTARGEKMSKSLGNGALVSEVTARHSGRAVRYYLAVAHYRSAIEYDDSALVESTAVLDRIDGFVARARETLGEIAAADTVPQAFADAMNDDLNTPEAVAVLHRCIREGNQALASGETDQASAAAAQVLAMLDVLGLNPNSPEWQDSNSGSDLRPLVDDLVGELVNQRQAARARKDFATADAVRDRLAELGVQIDDTPQGPRWTLTKGH